MGPTHTPSPDRCSIDQEGFINIVPNPDVGGVGCVITLADTQLFAGLAILISGFATLEDNMSTYHWGLVVDMGWLASATHLAALTFLRNHLANRPRQRLWRVTLMMLMACLLLVAMIIEALSLAPELPASCGLTTPLERKRPRAILIVDNILILAYGCSSRLLKLSPRLDSSLRYRANQWMRKSISVEESWRPLASFKSALLEPLRIALFRLIHVYLHMLTSLLGEICVLYVAIWVVTFRSFIFRAGGDEEEDTWTFGQIVPIVLLIAPIATLVEHFSRSEVAAQQRGPAPHTVVISLGNDDYEKSLGFFGVFLLLIPPYLSALFQSAFFSASPIAYLTIDVDHFNSVSVPKQFEAGD
ncbi:hypothetical protein S7711_08909 [Stachybotrys chartarum IBT 7711]|uniref:Uncharacterized protein n=1 Tax=Stachybotrys chartarum (strain CBS 109288 / IBT 7711) TaxID=1280523 RepID=A0A084B1V0_STACB|nr:hypothetical protein S7711_08909 [Stachybotrys chartarum IBT 7711]